MADAVWIVDAPGPLSKVVVPEIGTCGDHSRLAVP
jgi:hypothetical protein